MLTRRLAIKIILGLLAALTAFALLVSAAALAYPLFERTSYRNRRLALNQRLRIPPLLAPRSENGVKVFALTVSSGTTELLPGKATATLGFNGTHLGPTLRARRGDAVRFEVTNALDEAVTVHWHGMELPAAMDGGPHQVIPAGGKWRPHWMIQNRASTLWYHPHLMGKTGRLVYSGLAGLFLIDDEDSAQLGLPDEYGVDDIPLVVQDRLFDETGQLVYRHDDSAFITPGMLGDTILVNGTFAPYLEIPAKLVRLRILNGSNARRYNFGFSDGRPFHQIASDGGLLAVPVERTQMILAVAERAEILVDLSDAPPALTLISYPIVDPVNPIINLAQGMFLSGNDEKQQFQILELRAQAGSYERETIPPVLNTIERAIERDAVRTREFTLDPEARTINNLAMDHTRIDQIVRRGDLEIWIVRNLSVSYHPFHIHGVQFQVLDRDGKTPPPYEQGWKDTVMVLPAETVRLIMSFADYADPRMPYMFHCHILEHEDMGMMGQFVVVDDPSERASKTRRPIRPTTTPLVWPSLSVDSRQVGCAADSKVRFCWPCVGSSPTTCARFLGTRRRGFKPNGTVRFDQRPPQAVVDSRAVATRGRHPGAAAAWHRAGLVLVGLSLPRPSQRRALRWLGQVRGASSLRHFNVTHGSTECALMEACFGGNS
jgi:bilirubin oxidase